MAEITALERLQATIRCEKPDRVPIVPMVDFFAARYKGVPIVNFINDQDLARNLVIEVFNEFGCWDSVFASTSVTDFAFSLTLPMRLKLPGRELPPDTIWQFDEVPVMEIEDYDVAIEHGFQALAGSIVPSHAHVHLADFGKEVRVAGMLVRSGDLVHADRHGAVTIPEALAEKVPATCDLLARKEAVILEMARAPGFNVAKLREALKKQDEIH